MKFLSRFIFRLILLFTCMVPLASLHAQSTSFFNYQAMISDPAGGPYEGTVGIKISILQGSEHGEVVYSERHTKDSDENGFISFRVGEGDPVYTGDLDTINWSAGPSFIRTEIAPGGGYAYSIISITELVSVPMAMYARNADSIASDFREEDPLFSTSVASGITAEDTAKWNSLSEKEKYQIGDLLEGGIVFYIEPDGNHGLIASLSDIAEETNWGIKDLATGAVSHYDGQGNTEKIVSMTGAGDYAAYHCDTLSLNGYDDWYLPSADEMYLLFRNRYLINKILEEDGDDHTPGLEAETYWTSSERESSQSYVFLNGNLDYTFKDQTADVRAIRAF